ncbi:hypothetical protein IUY40_17365 [Flavobacterium sp. ALJ2]|uniref:hypothetical protein n=1 Tax=Flavobacterium sp. ALJ2 TaxID=2786960 RepID=UPI00189D5C7B|nr:hypothetical protein [Flavobacterium sp. ALJ2]MBF7093305.1 hypothetical protein [Flavobacterium sp. ALJ2]
MNNEHLLAMLRNAPLGHGIDRTRAWLKDIPEIKSFTEIESVFLKRDLSFKETSALILLLQRKYIDSADEVSLSDCCYNSNIKYDKIFDIYNGLSIFGDTTSGILDFSRLDKKLLKVKICAVKKAHKIVLPINKSFEALDISYTPKLTHIDNIGQNAGMKSLSFDKCKGFLDFKFVEKLNNLRILGISGNENLPELDFLTEKSNISILHLVETNAMKLKNTIDNLSKLKKLRHLSITANPKELNILREKLPACAINNMPSLNELLKSRLKFEGISSEYFDDLSYFN